jgi:FkbM family methyltransferase
MKKLLRKSLRRGTSAIPAAVLFWIGAVMRRLRLAMSEKSFLRFSCRVLDFLCCSLSPKVVLRHISCGTESFALWVRVNDPSHYDLVRGMYEAAVLEWLRKNLESGDTFWDVGANIGFYSILAARLVGPAGFVVAVEADPKVAEILVRNFEANQLSNARVISGAVTDHTGLVRLGRAPATGWTGLYYGKPDEWIDVPAFTGDSLLKSLGTNRVDAVKIDVEGAEACVLAGMTDVLSKMRPLLLIEVHRTHAGVEEQVSRILAACRFKCEILDRVDATMHIAAKPSLRSTALCNEFVPK